MIFVLVVTRWFLSLIVAMAVFYVKVMFALRTLTKAFEESS
jgi:hypothetical protein